MNATDSAALVRRLQEGKRRARAERPQRLERVEAAMDRQGTAYREAKARRDWDGMRLAREELRKLGRQRDRLQDVRTAATK